MVEDSDEIPHSFLRSLARFIRRLTFAISYGLYFASITVGFVQLDIGSIYPDLVDIPTHMRAFLCFCKQI